jgi:hypothetical protein
MTMRAHAEGAWSPAPARADRPSTWALARVLARRPAAAVAASFTLVSGLAMLVVSPRFGLDHLSAVDDWAAYSRSPQALRELARLSYDPTAVGDTHRYRPAFTGVWNGLVWHTLGAPGSLVGPNVWNTLRILLFVGATMALVLAALPRTTRLAVRVALAAGLPALVVTTPAPARDFARFGPAEPILVGAMVAGALLLVLGTGRWLTGAAWRHTAVPLGAGYALWLLGVYQKEISVCFFVAAPFVYLFLDRHWREQGTIERPLLGYGRFRVVAVAMLLPLVHMAYEIWRVAATGTIIYRQHTPQGPAGVADRLVHGTATQWAQMLSTLGSPLWPTLGLAGIALAVRSLRRRSTTDWLVAGFVVTGWALLAFEALSRAGTLSRYFLPSIVLFGTAAAVALASSTPRAQRAAAVLGLLLVALGGPASYWGVRVWTGDERESSALVDRVAALNPRACPVYMGRLDNELAHALPVLVALERQPVGCARGGEPLLVTRPGPKPYDSFRPVTDDRIFAACRAPGWSPVWRSRHFALLACRRLATGFATVLATDRLTPPEWRAR